MKCTVKSEYWFLPLACLIVCFGLLLAPVFRAQAAQQTAPDNTARNKDQAPPTADQQKMNASDRDITEKIRLSVHDDKTLSTNGHNIKIITQDGKVTLRGPVRSDEEKAHLHAKAASVVGDENVTDQLEVQDSH
jgi:hyperosmotically inducible protein